MNELKDILKAEIKSYEELVSILQKEREALISFTPDQIEALSREKDMIIMKIKLFDEERVNILSKISSQLQINKNINISNLLDITKDDDLRDLGYKLTSLVQTVNDLNEFNKILIEKSSRHINSFLCFLESWGVTPLNNRKSLKA